MRMEVWTILAIVIFAFLLGIGMGIVIQDSVDAKKYCRYYNSQVVVIDNLAYCKKGESLTPIEWLR